MSTASSPTIHGFLTLQAARFQSWSQWRRSSVSNRFRRAKKDSFDRASPRGQFLRPLDLRHRRNETAFEHPLFPEFSRLRTEARLQTREIGRAERRGLQDRWAIDRGSDKIGEALHRPVGGRHAAVDAQHRVADAPPILTHRVDEVGGLEADAFERGPGEFPRTRRTG